MSQDMNVYQRSTSSIGHLLRSSSPTSGGLYAWDRCGAVATGRCRPYEKLQLPIPHRSAPQEFGRPFFDETADAFSRVFRGLQPALLLLQLSRGDVRPFEYGFPRIGEGRCDREGSLLADQGCDFDRALALTPGRDHFLDEP